MVPLHSQTILCLAPQRGLCPAKQSDPVERWWGRRCVSLDELLPSNLPVFLPLFLPLHPLSPLLSAPLSFPPLPILPVSSVLSHFCLPWYVHSGHGSSSEWWTAPFHLQAHKCLWNTPCASGNQHEQDTDPVLKNLRVCTRESYKKNDNYYYYDITEIAKKKKKLSVPKGNRENKVVQLSVSGADEKKGRPSQKITLGLARWVGFFWHLKWALVCFFQALWSPHALGFLYMLPRYPPSWLGM